MKHKFSIAVISLIILFGFGWVISSVHAAPSDPQIAYPSPTPGADGRIIYIVKLGDNCERISLLYGVSLDYLRLTNQLDENCSLRENQSLILGFGGPSSASHTPGPSPTPTEVQPTATPGIGGIAKVCVLVYEDINGDSLRQLTEKAIAGAAVSVTSIDGAFSQTLTTVINPDETAYPGMCIENVPPGKYNISAAAPAGYNPTSGMTSSVEVAMGDVVYVDFSVQQNTTSASQPGGTSFSPLLGVVGAFFLLFGIGLGIYAWSMMRKK